MKYGNMYVELDVSECNQLSIRLYWSLNETNKYTSLIPKRCEAVVEMLQY